MLDKNPRPLNIIRDPKTNNVIFDEWHKAPNIVQERIDANPHLVSGRLTSADWDYIEKMRKLHGNP